MRSVNVRLQVKYGINNISHHKNIKAEYEHGRPVRGGKRARVRPYQGLDRDNGDGSNKQADHPTSRAANLTSGTPEKFSAPLLLKPIQAQMKLSERSEVYGQDYAQRAEKLFADKRF